MQLATIQNDYWELRNAEDAHRENPESFWIPDENARKNLKIGDAAKLIFDIELKDENGQLIIQGERGFVIVSEIVDDKYVGILDFQPASIEKGNDSVYLCFGAEIPFSYEHVVGISRPPTEYIEWQLNQKPERIWYRR